MAIATLRWADQYDDDVQDALASILEFETSTNAFFEWLSFDLRLDDDRTVAARFMDSRAWAISPRAVEHIRLMQDTHLRAYQVRDVTRDAGLVVRDLWSKEEFFVAEVRCDQGTLTAIAFSRERAERARARLEQEFGPLVLRHQRHESPDLDAPIAPPGSAGPEGTIALEQVPELAQWMAQRDREWLDLEIPALDGCTPREAAKDRRLRVRLRDLLIDMENREARMAGSGQGRDLTWMWKELGLRRP